jgi:hypothetical protein
VSFVRFRAPLHQPLRFLSRTGSQPTQPVLSLNVMQQQQELLDQAATTFNNFK